MTTKANPNRSKGQPAEDSGTYTINKAWERIHKLKDKHRLPESCPVYRCESGNTVGDLIEGLTLDKLLSRVKKIAGDAFWERELALECGGYLDPVTAIECVPDADNAPVIVITVDDMLGRESNKSRKRKAR